MGKDITKEQLNQLIDYLLELASDYSIGEIQDIEYNPYTKDFEIKYDPKREI